MGRFIKLTLNGGDKIALLKSDILRVYEDYTKSGTSVISVKLSDTTYYVNKKSHSVESIINELDEALKPESNPILEMMDSYIKEFLDIYKIKRND